MNLRKLRIENFERVQIINFPEDFDLGVETVEENAEVIIYYIDAISDVNDFLAYNEKAGLPQDNRTIMMYRKGRKDEVNRDNIMQPFKDGEHPDYKLKAPMLCAVSDELSAVVLKKLVD